MHEGASATRISRWSSASGRQRSQTQRLGLWGRAFLLGAKVPAVERPIAVDFCCRALASDQL
jgi:hypothetical protein